MKLVYQVGVEQLPDQAWATDYLDSPCAGGSLCSSDRRLNAFGDEREGQLLILFRRHPRRPVRHHQDRHLELVVADLPVRVVRHFERSPPHEDRTRHLDGGVHVRGASSAARSG